MLQIFRDDITKVECDAIVNAANSSLAGGGGVDGAIHRAAGPGLLKECLKLGGCPEGQARVTRGYKLPCRYVIHTVGPVWYGGDRGEPQVLASCYRESLRLAEKRGCRSVAFPLISAGAYGYPRDLALRVAVEEIGRFLADHDMLVYIIIYDRESFRAGSSLFGSIEEYIDENYVETHTVRRRAPFLGMFEQVEESRGAAEEPEECGAAPAGYAEPVGSEEEPTDDGESCGYETGLFEPCEWRTSQSLQKDRDLYFFPDPDETGSLSNAAQDKRAKPGVFGRKKLSKAASGRVQAEKEAPDNLLDLLRSLDESFSQMLLRKIDERGISDAECYRRANIDRKLFSKIRSDVHYRPSKQTAIAFAIALELPLDEARDMLMKAGFALSHSNKSDVIIEYFIKNGNYNIFEINEALFAFDQSLLGA